MQSAANTYSTREPEMFEILMFVPMDAKPVEDVLILRCF